MDFLIKDPNYTNWTLSGPLREVKPGPLLWVSPFNATLFVSIYSTTFVNHTNFGNFTHKSLTVIDGGDGPNIT